MIFLCIFFWISDLRILKKIHIYVFFLRFGDFDRKIHIYVFFPQKNFQLKKIHIYVFFLHLAGSLCIFFTNPRPAIAVQKKALERIGKWADLDATIRTILRRFHVQGSASHRTMGTKILQDQDCSKMLPTCRGRAVPG